ncbi:hypothetical protein K2X05_08440, partial [bacterium]|nr:hypothetical protein [bacterium]
MSTWSEYNPYRNGRSYVFAFPQDPGITNRVWDLNGTRRKGFWNDNKLDLSINKALSGEYKHFVVSDVVLNSPQLPKLLTHIRESGLKTTLQISEQTDLSLLAPFLQKDFLQIEWWVDQKWPKWETLRELTQKAEVAVKILGVKSNP